MPVIVLGIDTNVLVRILVEDDKAQCASARRLVDSAIAKGEKVFVSLLVLLEMEWVLRSRYGVAKPEILDIVSRMLDSVEFSYEDEPAIEEALFHWRESGADFADCLIGVRNRRLGCRATATFDVKAARLAGYVSVS